MKRTLALTWMTVVGLGAWPASPAAADGCISAEYCFCDLAWHDGPLLLVRVLALDPPEESGLATLTAEVADGYGAPREVGAVITLQISAWPPVEAGDLLLVRDREASPFLRVDPTGTEVRCQVDREQIYFFLTIDQTLELLRGSADTCLSTVRSLHPVGPPAPVGCGAVGGCSAGPPTVRGARPVGLAALVLLALVATCARRRRSR